MVSAGTHRAVVGDGMLGKTSKGNEQVAVSLQVIDEDGNVGESIAWFGYFTEKTEEQTIRALRTMGWRGDDLADLSSLGGAEVSIVVEHEEYEGKMTAKVRWVNAPGGGAILKDAMSPDEATSFAARMKAKVRAFDKVAGQPKTNGKPAPKSRAGGVLSPEPPPVTDDIPF